MSPGDLPSPAAGEGLGVGAIRTGTMGWSYEDWRGPFYNRDTPSTRMLEQYSRLPGYDTVELDTTFYGVPRPSTLEGWSAQTPPDFLFSAKVPRAITHERRLVHAAEPALDFAQIMRAGLGAKLGTLLIQLPPDFTVEERKTLETFVSGITRRREDEEPYRWVVELRSATWAGTDIVDSLAARGVSVAVTERLDLGGPLRYVRLLGLDGIYERFDTRVADRTEELQAWADRLDEARRDADAVSPILVYVRNTFEGHAPASIAVLREQLGLPVATPPGQRQMSLF